jgi:hypothetical protein
MKILMKNIKGKFSMERYTSKEFFHKTLFNLGHMHACYIQTNLRSTTVRN